VKYLYEKSKNMLKRSKKIEYTIFDWLEIAYLHVEIQEYNLKQR
jgi:hypothetical protein